MSTTYTIKAFSASNLTGAQGQQAFDPTEIRGVFDGDGPYVQGNEAVQGMRIIDSDPADGGAGQGHRADTFDDGVDADQVLGAPVTFSYVENGELQTVTFPAGTQVQSEFSNTMESGHAIMGIRLRHPDTGKLVTAGYYVDPPPGADDPPEPGTEYGEVAEVNDWGDYRYSGRNPVCFTSGTPIATPGGLRPVEALVAGDAVMTHLGPRRLTWVGAMTVPALAWTRRRSLWPVEIAANALGRHGTIALSPQHRVLLSGAALELSTGLHQALAPARALLMAGMPGVRQRPPQGILRYHHIALDGHGLVEAGGLSVETLWRGDMAIPGAPRMPGRPVRPILSARGAAALLATPARAGAVRGMALADLCADALTG